MNMQEADNLQQVNNLNDSESIRMNMDGMEISIEEMVADAKAKSLDVVQIFRKHFTVEEVIV